MATNNTVPLGNLTELNEQIYSGWMPPARTRGTSDILYTCTATIILCIWTAIHPNIPPPGAQNQWLNRAGWILAALFAPECVLWIAFTQFTTARQVMHRVNEAHAHFQPQSEDPPSDAYISMMLPGPLKDYVGRKPVQKPFADLTYGFWVVMGGFRVDVSHIDEDGAKSMCVTPDGIIALAWMNMFFELDKELIATRKRANALAKSVVCVEVLWMSLNCIARQATGLPLTLLELHTAVHVVCAVLMYGLWWKVRSCIATKARTCLTELETIWC